MPPKSVVMWMLLILKEVSCNVDEFLPGLFEFSADGLDLSEEVSQDCLKVITKMVDPTSDRSILLKMIDSMSKPSGILKGNIRDYGNFDECIEIDETLNEVHFLGKYCASGANIQAGGAAVSLSVCIPSVCTLKEISSIVTYKGVSFNDGMCQTKLTNSEFDSGDWAMSGLLIGIFCIILLSTAYDILLRRQKKEPKNDILVAFSVFTNGKNLLKTSNHPDLVHCLNGLRFISMAWIIAGHRFGSVLIIPTINTIDVMEFQNSFRSFYIQGALVAVDTFFFMSGFLTAYMYFKKVDKKPMTYKQIPLYYIHRLLRITPAVAVVFFMHLTLMRRIGSGPLFPTAMRISERSCRKWWWSFFLYIQNYVNYDDLCVSVTWYLSADMQMFILAPFLILPLGDLVRRGKKLVANIICGGVITLCIVIPMIIDFFIENKNEYATHARLSIYVVGIFMGMLLPELKKMKIRMNEWINLTIWIVSLLVMFAVVAYTYDVRMKPTQVKTNLFHSFSRPIWGFGLCWIIYSCTLGSGGIIAWFLSRPIFQVLGKLCYCMYLLHNPIIMISASTTKTGIYFSTYDIIYFWCGDFIFTLVLALIWYMAFESPMIVVEKVIFGNAGKSKRNKAELEAGLPPKTVVD